MSDAAQYVPGVCNINHDEIKKRRTIGVIGLVVTLAAMATIILADLPTLFRLTVFIPAFLMTTGFLQAKNKFCVGYAASGMRNVSGAAEHIEDKEAVAADKARARTMNLQVLAIAFTITVIFTVLPI